MNEREETSDDKAQADLRLRLKVMREVGETDLEALNFAISRNVLHEELGYFGPGVQGYAIDDRTRDILLVHGRQDAAHAALNSSSVLQQNRSLMRMTLALLGLHIVLIALVGFLIYRAFD